MSSVTKPLLRDMENGQVSIPSTKAIVDEDHELKLTLNNQRRLLRWKRQPKYCTLAALSQVVVAIFSAWGLVSLVLISTNILTLRSRNHPVFDVYRASTLPADLNSCSCGTTLASALALECIFDSMAAAWLPPECRDDELTAEFEISGTEPDGSWPYYADSEGQVRLSHEEMAALGPVQGVFWTTSEWHIAHCMFYWRKYYRMGQTGAVYEKRFDTLEHVKHCGLLAMEERPDSSRLQLIDVPVQMSSEFMIDPHALSEGNRTE